MSDARALSETDALREELRKLRKINAALMDRVERSTDLSANAFSMFETAISLEAMVRDRTIQLEDALGQLAKANSEIAAAHQTADAAQMRLRDAIESINEGFVLFDADDRLVLFNDAYLGFWPDLAPYVREGITFSDIAHLAAKHERPLGAAIAPDRWVSERLARHGIADGGHVQALSDGRWVQINELRTSEGGIVGIYTDITEVKAEDARARTRELAERNLILQSTLDTLSEGVCMFDSTGRLSAWNGALGRLLGLIEDPAQCLATHDGLIAWCRAGMGMQDHGCLDWRQDGPVSQLCRAGDRQFDIRSTRTGQGGQVFSFTDVTDMLSAQATLRETAETLERRVSERTGELLAVNQQLGREVAERRTIEAALTQAKIAAEKANLSKTSFLAAASHDLLQPLNAACLFVAALGDRRLALPTRALVSQTAIALDSVEDLLEALLEISRLDAGAIQPEISHFRIDQLLQTLNVEFTPMARAAGLEFRMETEPLWVESDLRLLRRILQNFISNAIRYTASGSVRVTCTVTCTAQGDLVKVAVIDTGRGIPSVQQALIFEEFRRLDTRSPGKGLGLAIVRRAADMLGHEILLDSAPGQGSSFAITLPLGRAAQEPVGDGIAAPRDRSMRGLRVLVVDNERQIQSGMRTLLGGWGCDVTVAEDYGEAVRLFATGERPDVILADYHLNDGETGDRVIARLHTHFGRSIPAAMISADRGEPLKAQLAASGTPLLNKPVKPAQLRALLRTMLP
jgi:signal transduction histidine kinase/CheY-like chemotaxis protein